MRIDSTLEIILLALQTFQVILLWTHDWIPLGRFNNINAVRSLHTTQQLIIVTLGQSLPWTIGLFVSAFYFGQPHPSWVHNWLWISYVVLFCGELRAWWLPYLFWNEPSRAVRYKIMFGNTHSFLPQRNGITPNTLHFSLHLATAATLVVLFITELKA